MLIADDSATVALVVPHAKGISHKPTSLFEQQMWACVYENIARHICMMHVVNNDRNSDIRGHGTLSQGRVDHVCLSVIVDSYACFYW